MGLHHAVPLFLLETKRGIGNFAVDHTNLRNSFGLPSPRHHVLLFNTCIDRPPITTTTTTSFTVSSSHKAR